MRILLLKTVSSVLARRSMSTKNFPKVTHCIFDMDGLLLDTERVYKQMITQICAQYGHEYTQELMLKVLGGTEQRLADTLCRELQLPITPEQFRDQLLQLGDTMLAGARLMPGAERLVRHLHAKGVPLALATSSSARSVRTKTAAHRDLFRLFQHIVTGSSDPEVKFGKPHPDIFLVAAARFPDKPDPTKCAVFEDSPAGARAGAAAGMAVVMVPERPLRLRLPPALTAGATLLLHSLEEFRPELLALPPFPAAAVVR